MFVSTQYKNKDFQDALLYRLPEQLHFHLLQRVTRPSSLPANKTTRYQRQLGRVGGENENDVRVREVNDYIEDWRLEEEELSIVDLEGRKHVKATSQQERTERESFYLGVKAERRSKDVFLEDAVEEESFNPGETKVVLQRDKTFPAKRGLEPLSRVKRSISTMYSGDINTDIKDESFEAEIKPKKLNEALFQQATHIHKTSDQVTIELLMAVYMSDGTATFNRMGYWTPASELVLNGPLHALPAPYFGGRVLTLTTIHVRICVYFFYCM